MPAPIVNPPGVRLHLTLTDSGPFREMQMIRGTVELDRQQQPIGVDGEPMWSLSGYLVDPPLARGNLRCGVPDNPCARHLGGLISNGHFWGGGHKEVDGPQPLRITELLPSLSPGNYRIAAVATRHQVYQGDAPAMPASPRPVVIAVSNWVALTIVPAADDWIQQTLTRNNPSPNPPLSDQGPAVHRAWLDQLHQLQLLDHPAAWDMIASMRLGGNQLTLEGLRFTRRPDQACTWLRDGLDNGSRRVDSEYLRTTTVVCGRVELPPNPIPPPPGTMPSPEYRAGVRAYAERQQAWHLQQRESLGARLLASLPNRDGRILADALGALLDLVPSAQHVKQFASGPASGKPQGGLAFAHTNRFFFGPQPAMTSEPTWASRFRQGLPQWVASLEPALRTHMLEQVAQHFESPDWAPVLESELRQLTAADQSGTARHLLFSLAALDSRRASNLVASELRKPETWLQPEMLDLIPLDPRPFSDEELVQMLDNHRSHGTNDIVWNAAVARFASPEAAPRVRVLYEQRLPACQVALVGYFVRSDPDYAATILGSNWDMRGALRPCYWEYLRQASSYGMGPVLEKFLVAHLFHSHVPLKQAAAQSLALHGSPAAQEALWEAMRHFRQYWKGREDELARHHEGVSFEVGLVHALTSARSWTLAQDGIETLRALCTSDQCLQQTGRLLRMWQQPLMVATFETQGRFNAQLGQYSPASPEELLARLKHLPAGTRIRISVGGPDTDTLREAIRAEAATAGLVVE